ncbi:MAG: Cys-tRNA(Pro)/Cys-tRNA(Cys) deacylase [Actinomycetota bacterium]|jgi:Cys-tRNA(Pro) deacylase|nr:Cys-tRNA(Pro)/Cys-tRNA(Cys) deacylase [Actinomycetota bacterium]
MVTPDTPATRALANTDLEHEVVVTERARSVEESAGFQGIDVTDLLKTLVVRRGDDDYVFVLVPGDRSIDWPKLRAHLGVSRLSLPDADEAREATGYERGAITPFGAAKAWPVIADAVVAGRSKVAIGGGAHGVNLHVNGDSLIAALGADVADVTKPAGG